MKKYSFVFVLAVTLLLINLVIIHKASASSPYDQKNNESNLEDIFYYRLAGIKPFSLNSIAARMSVTSYGTCSSGIVTGGSVRILVVGNNGGYGIFLGTATTSVNTLDGWMRWTFSPPINLPDDSSFYVSNDGSSDIHCSGSRTPNVFFDMVGDTANPASNYWYLDGSNNIIPQIELNFAAKEPILIIPGVLGTDIKQGDDLLWANPKMARGLDGFMDPLNFKNDLTPLYNNLTLGAVIREKTFGPIHFIYTSLLIEDLIKQGYTEGKDLFTFPYDWRFGVSSTTVDQLASTINYIVTQTDAGKTAGKVDIVAHSTGGLIVKRYVENNPSSHHISKAVFVGVPNLGSPKALKALLVGDSFDVTNLDPDEMKKLSQNFPVVYDLAPSQGYYNKTDGIVFHLHNPFDPTGIEKDLKYPDAIQNLIDHNLINNKGIINSEQNHTPDFENLDLRSYGVDLYNIVGCKIGTFGTFRGSISESGSPIFDFPKETNGDGTVPFLSADSIPADQEKTFFVPAVKHGDLLSTDGPRQEIENLLTNGQLDTKGKVLSYPDFIQHPEKCLLKGHYLWFRSPVTPIVTDEEGNISGLANDGSIQNDIPGADYEVWGEHKYVFLPTDEGQQYQINLTGTDNGTFTVDDQVVDGNEITKTQVFSNLPVTTNLTGSVNLNEGGNTTLTIQLTPTSSPITLQPDSIIDGIQSQDLIAPVSTSTIIGTMGQVGFYRSDVKVSLSAQDPVVVGQETQTSGLLKIQYSVDGGAYQIYGSSSPIFVTTEGEHVINFFSTDRAGNNELEQSIGFAIDKTPPEFNIQFNPATQDLDFTATDSLPTILSTTTLSSAIKKGFRGFPICPIPRIKDSDDVIVATDAAGNTTQINLQNKDRRRRLAADIKSLSYNGKTVDLGKASLHFNWLADGRGKALLLTQQVQSKKDFNILALYTAGRTMITGKDQNGKILKNLNGLTLVKVLTNNGDLNWSY